MSGARTQIMDVFAPVLATVNAPIESAATYVRVITGLADLQSENIRLEAENQRLREWYQTAMQLETRVNMLEGMLQIATDPKQTFVTARIIADSGNAYVRSMIILAGNKHNVVKGSPVISAEGLVGRVTDAGKSSSRVLLLTDVNSRIPVLVEGRNWRAVLAGNNSESPTLAHLPPEAYKDLEEGMRIVTSGNGGMFPFGLPVGQIFKTPEGQWQVRLYADINRLIYVRVIEQAQDSFLNVTTEPASQNAAP
jgi:rod shape-determining protein MreC